MSFQLAEKALRSLVDAATLAGDDDAAHSLTEALDAVLAVGGWRAFPVAAPSSETRNKNANALRQERYRAAKRNAQSVTSGVTSNVTRNAQSVTADVIPASLSSSSESGNAEKEAEKKEEQKEERARDVTRNASSNVTPVTRNARNVTPLRGSRITPDYVPRDETLSALVAEGHTGALKSLPAFRDYWTAKPGKDGCKLDWDATFRNWVRNERPRFGNPSGTFVKHVQPSENRAWKLPEGAE